MGGKSNGLTFSTAMLATVMAQQTAVAEDPSTTLAKCAEEQDDARRLACYDRAIGTQEKRPIPGAAAPPATAPVPAKPDEELGARELRDQQEREAESSDPNRPTELVAKVAEIAKRPNGTHVITLDNGQVWVESSIDYSFRVKVGETVKIRRAALGSFLLSTPGKHSTRVTRQK